MYFITNRAVTTFQTANEIIILLHNYLISGRNFSLNLKEKATFDVENKIFLFTTDFHIKDEEVDNEIIIHDLKGIQINILYDYISTYKNVKTTKLINKDKMTLLANMQ